MAEDWTEALPEAARAYLEGRRLDEVECIIPDLPGIGLDVNEEAVDRFRKR